MTARGPVLGRLCSISAIVLVAALAASCGSEARPAAVDSCKPEARRAAGLAAPLAIGWVERVLKLRRDVIAACATIAEVGGVKVDVSLDAPTDEDIYSACQAATKASEDIFGEGNVALSIRAGRCPADTDAQLSCEAAVAEDCEPGEDQSRCEEPAGRCAGECAGICHGSEETPVPCAGACQGRCTGVCIGSCLKPADDDPEQCDGPCEGSCEGSCAGVCAVAAGNCGDALCEGPCSVELKDPVCFEPLAPGGCLLSPSCSGMCAALASLADCEPPSVEIVTAGPPLEHAGELGAALAVLLDCFDVAQALTDVTDAAGSCTGRSGCAAYVPAQIAEARALLPAACGQVVPGVGATR